MRRMRPVVNITMNITFSFNEMQSPIEKPARRMWETKEEIEKM